MSDTDYSETIECLLYDYVKISASTLEGNLLRMKRGLHKRPVFYTVGWGRGMFQLILKTMIGHDLARVGKLPFGVHRIIPAKDVDLETAREVIIAEANRVQSLRQGHHNPSQVSFEADLIRMHIFLNKTFISWSYNNRSAHTLDEICTIAAMILLRTKIHVDSWNDQGCNIAGLYRGNPGF